MLKVVLFLCFGVIIRSEDTKTCIYCQSESLMECQIRPNVSYPLKSCQNEDDKCLTLAARYENEPYFYRGCWASAGCDDPELHEKLKNIAFCEACDESNCNENNFPPIPIRNIPKGNETEE